MKKYLPFSWKALPKYLFLILISAMMLFPFYWMFVTSFKTGQELSVYPPTWFPVALNLDNYVYVLNTSPLQTYFLNSSLTALLETLLVLLLTTLTAYGLYRFHFRGKQAFFAFFIVLHALPFEVIMVFLYQTMIHWGLNDTLLALILPFCCNFMYVYILYNAFQTIPYAVCLAAGLDGASHLKFLFRIALPHARPSLVFITIINAVGCWNSFIWPMMITNSISSRTLPFGLYAYMTETGSHNELIMAMSVLSQFPIMLLFILLRKNFVNGYRSQTSR